MPRDSPVPACGSADQPQPDLQLSLHLMQLLEYVRNSFCTSAVQTSADQPALEAEEGATLLLLFQRPFLMLSCRRGTNFPLHPAPVGTTPVLGGSFANQEVTLPEKLRYNRKLAKPACTH